MRVPLSGASGRKNVRRDLVLSALTVLLAGCTLPPRPPADGTETPDEIIARQQTQIQELKADVIDREAQVKRLQEEAVAAAGLRPEFAQAEVRVERVTLGRYSHVAHLENGRPGPNGLKVYLHLEDRDGDPLKRAGQVHLKAFDLRHEVKLGDWSFNPREALRHWKAGFLLNCFVFELPFQEPPADARQVDLYWEFIDLHGRCFTGTQNLFFTATRTP
jgi:hypothetical protein